MTESKKINLNLYFINLTRSKNRKNNLIKHLNPYFKNLIRVSAFDYKLKNDKIRLLNCCNKIEQVVSYSHIKAINKAYNDGCDEAFISEDDVYLDFVNKLEISVNDIIKFKPNDTECIIFYQTCRGKMIKSLNTKKMFVPHEEDHDGAVIYYITRKGMKKIIDLYLDKKHNKFDLSTLFCDTKLKNRRHNSERVLFFNLKTYIYSKPTFNIRREIISTIGHSEEDNGVSYINNGILFI